MWNKYVLPTIIMLMGLYSLFFTYNTLEVSLLYIFTSLIIFEIRSMKP